MVNDEKNSLNDHTDDKTNTSKIVKTTEPNTQKIAEQITVTGTKKIEETKSESTTETCFSSLFEDENQIKQNNYDINADNNKERRDKQTEKQNVNTIDTIDHMLDKQNELNTNGADLMSEKQNELNKDATRTILDKQKTCKTQKKDICKLGNDKNIIKENMNKKQARNKTLKQTELRNQNMLEKTNINVQQHKHLFKSYCTMSNLYHIFANPISEENMKKLEVFYYKKAAIVCKRLKRGYTIFVSECSRSINYSRKGINCYEMEKEIRRIWCDELSEEQRDMYRKAAQEQNKKEGRYTRAYK